MSQPTTTLHSTAPLSSEEARALTDRIRQTTEALWSLLLEAYERRAWRALGYDTWQAYVEAEFSMSRSNSYRLLDQGRVIRALSEAAGADVPHAGQITQRDADALKGDLPAAVVEVRARVEQGEEPAEAVRAVVETKRADTKPAAPEPPPEEEVDPEYGAPPEYDPAAELAHALEETIRLQALVDSLQSDDTAAELTRLSERYARLEGRVQQLLTTANEYQKQAGYQSRLLKQIREALGVEKDREILPAIQARRAAA